MPLNFNDDNKTVTPIFSGKREKATEKYNRYISVDGVNYEAFKSGKNQIVYKSQTAPFEVLKMPFDPDDALNNPEEIVKRFEMLGCEARLSNDKKAWISKFIPDCQEPNADDINRLQIEFFNKGLIILDADVKENFKVDQHGVCHCIDPGQILKLDDEFDASAFKALQAQFNEVSGRDSGHDSDVPAIFKTTKALLYLKLFHPEITYIACPRNDNSDEKYDEKMDFIFGTEDGKTKGLVDKLAAGYDSNNNPPVDLSEFENILTSSVVEEKASFVVKEKVEARKTVYNEPHLSQKYLYENPLTGDRGILMQYTLQDKSGNTQTYDFHKQMSFGTARILTAAPITLSAAEWTMFKERGHGLHATSMVSRTISTLGIYIAEIEKKYNLYPTLNEETQKYNLSQADLDRLKKADPNAFDKYCLVRILQSKLAAFYEEERNADPNHITNQEILKAGLLKILGTARHLFIQTLGSDHSKISSDHVLYYAECAVKDFKWARDPKEPTRFLAPTKQDQLEPEEGENVSYDSSDDESTAAGHTVFQLKGMSEKGLASYIHCLMLMRGFNPDNRAVFKAIAQELGASRGILRGERMSETPVEVEAAILARDVLLELKKENATLARAIDAVFENPKNNIADIYKEFKLTNEQLKNRVIYDVMLMADETTFNAMMSVCYATDAYVTTIKDETGQDRQRVSTDENNNRSKFENDYFTDFKKEYKFFKTIVSERNILKLYEENESHEKINIAHDPLLEGRAQAIAEGILIKLRTNPALDYLKEIETECLGEKGLGASLSRKLAASALAKVLIEASDDDVDKVFSPALKDRILKILSPFYNLADINKKRTLTTDVKEEEEALETLEKEYDAKYQAALTRALAGKTSSDDIKAAVNSLSTDNVLNDLKAQIDTAKTALNTALRKLHPELLKPKHEQGGDLVRHSFMGSVYEIVNPIAEVVYGMGLRDPIRGAIALSMMGITAGYVAVVAAHAGSVAAASSSSKFIAALTATKVFPGVVHGVLPLSASSGKLKVGFTSLVDGLVMGKATYLLSSLTDTPMGRESYLGNIMRGIANNPVESAILVAALVTMGHFASPFINKMMGEQSGAVSAMGWQMFDDLCESAKPALILYNIGVAIKSAAFDKGEIGSAKEKENLDKRLVKLFAGGLFGAIPPANQESITLAMLEEKIHAVLRDGKFDLSDSKGLEKFNAAIALKFEDSEREIVLGAIQSTVASRLSNDPKADKSWELAKLILAQIPAEFTREQKEALFVARFADAKMISAANSNLSAEAIAAAVVPAEVKKVDRARSEAWHRYTMPTALAFLKNHYPEEYQRLNADNKNDDEIKNTLGRQFVKELIRDKNSLLLHRNERWKDLFERNDKHNKQLKAEITHTLSEVFGTKITDLEQWIKMQETPLAAEALKEKSVRYYEPTAGIRVNENKTGVGEYDDLFFMMRGFADTKGTKNIQRKTGLKTSLDFLEAIYPKTIKRYESLYLSTVDRATVLKNKFEHDLLLSNRNKTDLWKNFASDENLQKQYKEITGKVFQADSVLAERLLSDQESKRAARDMWKRAGIIEKIPEQGRGEFDNLFYAMKGPDFKTEDSQKYVEIRRLDTPLEFLKALYPKIAGKYQGVSDDVMQTYLALQFQKDLLISRRDNTALWQTVSADHALQKLITPNSAGATFKELQNCEIKKALTVSKALSGTIVGGIANFAKAFTGNEKALVAEVEGLAKVVTLVLRIPATIALVTITAPIYAASMTISKGMNDVGGTFSRFTTTLSRAFTAARGKYFVKRPDDVPDYRSSMVDVRVVEPSFNVQMNYSADDFIKRLKVVAETYVNNAWFVSPMMKKVIDMVDALNKKPIEFPNLQQAVLFVLSRLFPQETETLFALMDAQGVPEEKRNDTMLASLQRLFAEEMKVYNSEKKDTFKVFADADADVDFQKYLAGEKFDFKTAKHPVDVVAENVGKLTDDICDNLIRDAKILNAARREAGQEDKVAELLTTQGFFAPIRSTVQDVQPTSTDEHKLRQ